MTIPCMGVADDLLAEIIPNSVDRFRFWLLTAAKLEGEFIWRRLILENCLPSDFNEDELESL